MHPIVCQAYRLAPIICLHMQIPLCIFAAPHLMPEALQLLSLVGEGTVCSGSFCLSFLQQPAHQLPGSCQLSLQACGTFDQRCFLSLPS